MCELWKLNYFWLESGSIACSLDHVFNIELISYFDELYCQRIHWHWQLADILMIVLNIISKRKWWHLHFQTPLTRLQDFKIVFWSSSSPSRQFTLESRKKNFENLGLVGKQSLHRGGPWIRAQNQIVAFLGLSYEGTRQGLWFVSEWTLKA